MRRDLVLVFIVTVGLGSEFASPSAAWGTSDRGAGSRSTAGVECIIFSDQVEFESFNEQQGLLLEGIEDFEEGTLPPGAITPMDDPLCGGIPSSPPGTPYPEGLLQLNLCVQSNLLGGAPDVPKPSSSGIRAISAGFQGAVSDIVTSGTFVHSFDVIFSGPSRTGVGLNPIVILGGATAEIRIYDQNESLLVMETVPADAAGSNFFGVFCPQSIGRINFFDVGNGIEGGDNIQMWVSPTGECGDDTCQPGETCENCPEDCGPCAFCGDGEVNQPSEECDPPGLPSTCPNNEACLPDCTCGDLCGDEICSGDEDECNCPQDCPGVCPECVFFFDQAEFEAFNEGQGQLMKGFEDFEESILPLFGVDTMDDPLCGGIPNLPDGFPFPNGLDEPNLCLQSNLDLSSGAPNARGADGLAAVSAGFLGMGSDIVLANFFIDSLDLMFTGSAHTAVGFNTFSASGGFTAQVRVYGEDDVLLALEIVPLDEAGINFTGVSCNLPIARINLFDPANGAEGGDNIQMWSSLECGDGVCAGETCETCPEDCGPCLFCGDGEVNEPSEECDPPGFPSTCPNSEACLPDCTCGDVCGDELCSGDEDECNCPQDCPGECPCILFFDSAEFETFNEQGGLILKGIETFEESVLPPDSTDRFDGPLCGGVPNAPDAFPFPNGLDEPNLCVQSNNLGGNPTMPSPTVDDALVTVSAGFLGATSDVVTAGFFVDSFDMVFSKQNHTALGFDTISFPDSGTGEIRVYDRNGILLAMGTAPVDPAGSNFFGVWCQQPIGRVNLFDPGDPGGGAEGADNIQMWVVDGSTLCGECATDVDRSGDTSAFDLAFLLGLWGPCAPSSACACLDADDDGLLGPADLAVLLGSWGPCE